MTFEKITASLTKTASASAVGAIRLYQKTHILRAPSCRFYPSCSQYMVESIQRFGLFRGLFLGSGRICRCQPLNAGGVDEVPVSYPLTLSRFGRLVRQEPDSVNGVKSVSWRAGRLLRLLVLRKQGLVASPRGSR